MVEADDDAGAGRAPGTRQGPHPDVASWLGRVAGHGVVGDGDVLGSLHDDGFGAVALAVVAGAIDGAVRHSATGTKTRADRGAGGGVGGRVDIDEAVLAQGMGIFGRADGAASHVHGHRTAGVEPVPHVTGDRGAGDVDRAGRRDSIGPDADPYIRRTAA